ncbi:hypothetical protein [Kribbella sp. NPDC006257]|uniref:hypothetical protein n=1 Tax=Kribbella sp. NPDC006257 TaxID=3156738 RepID=UPI0033B8AD11
MWSWLAAAAPYVWWRATAIEGHRVAVVIWDRTADDSDTTAPRTVPRRRWV